MDSLNDAEANLRTIRQLMERATTYRAISGPVALVAGFLACLNCFYFAYFGEVDPAVSPTWISSWFAILIMVLLTNAVFLYRAARGKKERFFNPRFLLALRATAPALLVGGLVGFLSGSSGQVYPERFWLLFYGLALSSMAGFAPKSLQFLGWSVTAIAVVMIVGIRPLISLLFESDIDLLSDPEAAIRILPMFIGFGLTHLFYAACVPWKIAPDD